MIPRACVGFVSAPRMVRRRIVLNRRPVAVALAESAGLMRASCLVQSRPSVILSHRWNSAFTSSPSCSASGLSSRSASRYRTFNRSYRSNSASLAGVCRRPPVVFPLVVALVFNLVSSFLGHACRIPLLGLLLSIVAPAIVGAQPRADQHLVAGGTAGADLWANLGERLIGVATGTRLRIRRTQDRGATHRIACDTSPSGVSSSRCRRARPMSRPAWSAASLRRR